MGRGEKAKDEIRELLTEKIFISPTTWVPVTHIDSITKKKRALTKSKDRNRSGSHSRSFRISEKSTAIKKPNHTHSKSQKLLSRPQTQKNEKIKKNNEEILNISNIKKNYDKKKNYDLNKISFDKSYSSQNKIYKKRKRFNKTMDNFNIFPNKNIKKTEIIKNGHKQRNNNQKIQFPLGLWYKNVLQSRGNVFNKKNTNKFEKSQNSSKIAKRKNNSFNNINTMETMEISDSNKKDRFKNRRRSTTKSFMRRHGRGTLWANKSTKDCIIKNDPFKKDTPLNLTEFHNAQLKRYNQFYYQNEVEKFFEFQKKSVALLKDPNSEKPNSNYQPFDFEKLKQKILEDTITAFDIIYKEIKKFNIDIASISKSITVKFKPKCNAIINRVIFEIFFKNGRMIEISNLDTKELKELKIKMMDTLEDVAKANMIDTFHKDLMKILKEIEELIIILKQNYYLEEFENSKKIFNNSFDAENSMKWKLIKGKAIYKDFGTTKIEALIEKFQKKKSKFDKRFIYDTQNIIGKKDSVLSFNEFLRKNFETIKDLEAKEPFWCI